MQQNVYLKRIFPLKLLNVLAYFKALVLKVPFYKCANFDLPSSSGCPYCLLNFPSTQKIKKIQDVALRTTEILGFEYNPWAAHLYY